MPTETLTTNDGRFRLSGVLEGPALVFAEKEGFRFGFRPIDGDRVAGVKPALPAQPPGHEGEADSATVTVVLVRTSEPPAVAYHTLPPALPVEEEKALRGG